MTFIVLICWTGEEVVEPEVDLSSFLERQRLSPQPSSAPPPPDEDEDVDTSLVHLIPRQSRAAQSKKGKVQQIEWDVGLDELSHEKAAAEAKRGKYIFTALLSDQQIHTEQILRPASAHKRRGSAGRPPCEVEPQGEAKFKVCAFCCSSSLLFTPF